MLRRPDDLQAPGPTRTADNAITATPTKIGVRIGPFSPEFIVELNLHGIILAPVDTDPAVLSQAFFRINGSHIPSLGSSLNRVAAAPVTVANQRIDLFLIERQVEDGILLELLQSFQGFIIINFSAEAAR